jgi:hypothetical protein
MLKFDFVWNNYWGIYLDYKLKKKEGEIKDNCHGSWRRNKTKKKQPPCIILIEVKEK